MKITLFPLAKPMSLLTNSGYRVWESASADYNYGD